MRMLKALLATSAIILVTLDPLPIWGLAFGAERTPLGVQLLPCGGTITFYDTDGDPTNGAEVLEVYAEGEDTPRAVVTFASGNAGVFQSAAVRIPGKAEVHFTTDESFGMASTAPSAMAAASASSDDTTSDSKLASCGSRDVETAPIVSYEAL